MSAREWAASARPHDLIECVREGHKARAQRPLRFFAVHCCRLALAAMPDARSRQALDVAERSLCGLVTAEHLAEAVGEANAARQEASQAYQTYAADPATRGDHPGRAERMSHSLGAHVAFHAASTGYYDGMITHVRDALAFSRLAPRGALMGPACRILREVAANPLRPPAFRPEWRTETAVLLARQMSASNDFGAMPVLADALQDAGCDCDAVLAHCRDAASMHLRGCWVLELLLGPE